MTITLNPGIDPGSAGSGASSELLGTDDCGGLTITTGTGSAGGTIAKLVLDTALYGIPSVEVAPLDSTTQAIFNGISFQPYAAGTGNKISSVGLVLSNDIADNTTYRFAYRIV